MPRRWPSRRRAAAHRLLPKLVLVAFAVLLVRLLASPPPPPQYTSDIAHAAETYRVPRALIEAVIQEESGGNRWAVSSAGALGLMQAMPDKFRKGQDPFSPAVNIDVGTRYLAAMLHEFHGNVTLALAAYNAGPNAVLRHRGVPPYPQTVAYVRGVLSTYRRISQERGTGDR